MPKLNNLSRLNYEPYFEICLTIILHKYLHTRMEGSISFCNCKSPLNCLYIKQPSSLKYRPWHSLYEGHSGKYIKHFIPFYFNFRIHHLHQFAFNRHQQLIFYQWHQTLNNNFQGFSTEGHSLALVCIHTHMQHRTNISFDISV